MVNPIAAWALDESTGTTAADATGNGHTLTLGTGGTWTASGHTNAALENAGGGNTTGASGTVPAVSGTTCTLMAWVKPTALPSGGIGLIAGSLDAAGTDFALWTERTAIGSPNVLQGNARLGGGVVAVSGTALTVGTWAHVALTYDGSTLKLWLNGSVIASGANTNTINNRTSFVVAGLAGNYPGNCVVDDLRYFSTDESANIATWMNTPVAGSASSVTGTAAASFGGLSGVLTGTRSLTGAAAATLGGLTGSATGVVADSGVAQASFGALTAALTGVRGTDGAAAASFGGLTGSMTAGSGSVSGTAGASFGGLAGAVTAERTVIGYADLTGGPLSARLSDGSTQHHPSSTLVMLAWLRQIAGVPASATLPPPAKWFATGMTTVTPVGGNPDMYNPERAPVLQVDCWAVNPAAAGAKSVSRKTPRGAANELADIVVMATYTLAVPPVQLPAQFLPVWIESAVAISEVREIPEPDNSYAHYSVDVQLRWVERAPAVNL